MQDLNILILTLLSTVLPLVSGWGIMFYSGENCIAAHNFNSVSYFGYSTDSSWCLEAGAPGQNCKWYTNEGATESDCTTPTRPMPGSFRYSRGSSCCVQIDQDTQCTHKACFVAADDCYPTKYFPLSEDGPSYRTFTCSDAAGVRRTSSFNATNPGALPFPY